MFSNSTTLATLGLMVSGVWSPNSHEGGKRFADGVKPAGKKMLASFCATQNSIPSIDECVQSVPSKTKTNYMRGVGNQSPTCYQFSKLVVSQALPRMNLRWTGLASRATIFLRRDLCDGSG